MSTTTEALTEFYAAVNRNDIAAITKDFDPEIVHIEPEGFATAGTHRGTKEVQDTVRKGRSTWAEGSCDIEQFFGNQDKTVVFLHARVRLHNATEWTGGRFADGFVFRDGKITEYRTFWKREEALKWAGIDAASTS